MVGLTRNRPLDEARERVLEEKAASGYSSWHAAGGSVVLFVTFSLMRFEPHVRRELNEVIAVEHSELGFTGVVDMCNSALITLRCPSQWTCLHILE